MNRVMSILPTNCFLNPFVSIPAIITLFQSHITSLHSNLSQVASLPLASSSSNPP